MEKDFNVDQFEWLTLLNLSEKNLRKLLDDLTRCNERIRQCNERAESCRYKAMTCSQDSEYLMRDLEDASQSKRQCIQDALHILMEIPNVIDLLQSALCKGLCDE